MHVAHIAAEMLNKGNLDGHAVWMRILLEIDELLNTDAMTLQLVEGKKALSR